MVFESLDDSFSGILVMNMRGDKLVRDIFLEKGIIALRDDYQDRKSVV